MSQLLYTLVINNRVIICVDFQRPVWFYPNSEGMRLIPQRPDTITQDAVLFYGLSNLNISNRTKNKIKKMMDEGAKSVSYEELPEKYLEDQDYLLQLDKYPDNYFDEIRSEMANATLSGDIQVIKHQGGEFNFGCKVKSPCIAVCQDHQKPREYIFNDREA